MRSSSGYPVVELPVDELELEPDVFMFGQL